MEIILLKPSLPDKKMSVLHSQNETERASEHNSHLKYESHKNLR